MTDEDDAKAKVAGVFRDLGITPEQHERIRAGLESTLNAMLADDLGHAARPSWWQRIFRRR